MTLDRRRLLGVGMAGLVEAALSTACGGARSGDRRGSAPRSGASATDPIGAAPPVLTPDEEPAAPLPPLRELLIPPGAAFAVGSVTLFDDRVLVLRDQRGLYAVSAICTHQGCTVGFEDGHLLCDCHFATYDLDGAVTYGPAKLPLANLLLQRQPDGALLVTTHQVPRGTRLRGRAP